MEINHILCWCLRRKHASVAIIIIVMLLFTHQCRHQLIIIKLIICSSLLAFLSSLNFFSVGKHLIYLVQFFIVYGGCGWLSVIDLLIIQLKLWKWNCTVLRLHRIVWRVFEQTPNDTNECQKIDRKSAASHWLMNVTSNNAKQLVKNISQINTMQLINEWNQHVLKWNKIFKIKINLLSS